MRSGWMALMRKNLRLGVTTVALALAGSLLLLLCRKPETVVIPNGVEISTQFLNDPAEQILGHAYDQIGDPVCLAGVLEPVGKVKNLELRHSKSGTKYWQISILLDRRYQQAIPRGSEVFHRWIGLGTSCDVRRNSLDPRGRVLEIDPRTAGRQKATASPIAPIEEHAVLTGVVDQGCVTFAGPVTICDIVEFLPRPWWRATIDRASDFVNIDIGVIWIEVVAASIVVGGAVLALVSLVDRNHRTNKFGRP